VIRVIALTFGLVILIMSGCGPSSTSSSSTGKGAGKISTDNPSAVSPVAIQLNWYPESEHGGVFQAEADGAYQAAGLKVDIRPGGRTAPVAQELALGRVQFGFANADDVVVYRRQGLDVVAVLAAMQDNPRCILVQEKSGVDSLNDLAGLPGRTALLGVHAVQRTFGQSQGSALLRLRRSTRCRFENCNSGLQLR